MSPAANNKRRYSLLMLPNEGDIQWRSGDRLVTESSGVTAPPEAGILLFLLWAGLFAARHLDQLLTDVSRGASISFWNALTVGSLGMVTATGLQGWIYRLRLYRTRKLQTGDGDSGSRPGR
jgi:hypothetical protein